MSISVLIVEDEPEFLRRFSDAVLRELQIQFARWVLPHFS